MQIRQHQLSINSLGILVLKHRWKIKYRTKIGKTIKLVFDLRICIRIVILKIFHFETDRDFRKKKKKRSKNPAVFLNNPFFFTIRTRVAVTYSFATCSSIMQIHMHERCTYNSLSLARVTNAWRFAGSICQLAEKTDEIKWKNEREKNRTSRRKGQIETSNKARLRKEERE